jgi:hypothetical protein
MRKIALEEHMLLDREDHLDRWRPADNTNGQILRPLRAHARAGIRPTTSKTPVPVVRLSGAQAAAACRR